MNYKLSEKILMSILKTPFYINKNNIDKFSDLFCNEVMRKFVF